MFIALLKKGMQWRWKRVVRCEGPFAAGWVPGLVTLLVKDLKGGVFHFRSSSER